MNAEANEQVRYRPGYIPGLDGIRALSIGLVLFSHSVILDESTYLHKYGHEAGYTGVAVFFVLSGYLITTLLLREENRNGSISLGQFYLRRALRLFPVLWLYLLVIVTLRLAGGLSEHPWSGLLSSFLYIRNITGSGHETDHLWSLSLEEQFYLLWPLVLVCLPHRDKTRLIVAACGLSAVTAWRAYATRNGLASYVELYKRSDFRLDAPLFGCILALLQQVAPSTIHWTNSSPRRSSILTVAGIATWIAWVGFGLDRSTPYIAHSTVVCLLGIPLILSQVGVQSYVSRWLAWSPLVAIGQISYGLYLWHGLFMGPLVNGFQHIRVFPAGLISTFIVAATSYRLLELPLLRLKDRRLHAGSTRGCQSTPRLPPHLTATQSGRR